MSCDVNYNRALEKKKKKKIERVTEAKRDGTGLIAVEVDVIK